jgi:hypothetical protein
MKNSMKYRAGVGLILLAVTGAGFGQENVKTVEGYRIDPPKAEKAGRATKSDKAVAVAGYAIAPNAAIAGGGATVEGFALPDND